MDHIGSKPEALSGSNFLCPEVLHPGQTGCKYVDVVDRLERVERLATSHTETLIEIKAYGKATSFWMKAIAGLVAAIGVAAAIYFGSLEARGKAGMLRPQPGVAASPEIIARDAHQSSTINRSNW